jgi:hypothetical protein
MKTLLILLVVAILVPIVRRVPANRVWPAHADFESYDHFERVTLFVGQRDSILARAFA